MHPFCCVSSITMQSNSDMPPSPPSDLLNRIQNPALPRALSARDSVTDSIGALVSSNNHNPNHHHSHHHSRELKINDIVGNGISGILYKWVNYGKGWRPRWFVLQDGVLSYYKIHGPDKIVVNQETEKGSRVIGEESLKRISRQHNNHHHHHRNGSNGSSAKSRNPVGEVHLKVSLLSD